jgi:DNA-binding transcriptional MerR regulator
MTEELLQIGEFAKRADTNLRTLRYYEELGLIRPARRDSGKFRYYSPIQLKRIESIKRLQGLGLSLREVQEIMVPSPVEREDVLTRLAAGLDRQIELVGERVTALQAELGELREARARIEGCRACEQEFDTEGCQQREGDVGGPLLILRALA